MNFYTLKFKIKFLKIPLKYLNRSSVIDGKLRIFKVRYDKIL